MKRFDRFGALLAAVEREHAATVDQISVTIDGQRIVPKWVMERYDAMLSDLYTLHIDSQRLGVLHALDRGEKLGNVPWRWEPGAWPTRVR